MAWPFDQSDGPHLGELLIDGTWTDVSSRIRGEHAIRISRGRRDIQGSALLPPGTCDFTLNNADGLFTDDNPLSPYFGKLPIYTQFRLSMPGAAPDHYLYLPGHDTTNYVRTSDKAALDITGDIDIRIDIAPAAWNMYDEFDGSFSVLASKTGNANTDLSWMLALRSDGKPYLNWSTTGSGPSGLGFTGPVLDSSNQRMAIRVTLDVNNGAGTFELKWYSSDTIDGSWTLLSTILGSTYGFGTTSIYSGSGLVEVGSGFLGGSVYSTGYTYSGKVYAFELRNGIGGTLVAKADFRTLPYGNADFSDGLGNTWNIRNGAVITSDEIRFWGEVEEFPQEWDETGRDMFSRVHASDLLARLGTSQQPVQSPIEANRMQYDPTGYWTFQDGSDATRASASSRLTQPASTIAVQFKAADDLPGSDGVARFQSGSALVRGSVRPSSITGTASGLFFFKFTSLPAATVQLISFTMTGSNITKWWRIETDGGSFTVKAYDADGNTLVSSAILTGSIDLTKWVGIRLELTTPSAFTTDWAIAWHQVGTGTFLGGSGSLAASVGRIASFTVNGSSLNTDMYFSHVWIDTSLVDFVTSEFRNSANGYIGEKFGSRFRRICGQVGVNADVDGWYFDTSPVGRQRADTPLAILQEGADVDGGVIMGSRRQGNTLTYVTRSRIQAAAKVASISHSSSHLAATPRPTKGVVGVANDVKISRPDGGSSRVVVASGRVGTDTIGSVPYADTLNVEDDAATEELAGWIATLRSSGEYRFPEIKIGLHRQATLFGSAVARLLLAADIGRWMEISSLPAGQAPGPYEQLVQGYSEVIVNKTWDITFNGTPYGPWRAGILENGAEPVRFADDGLSSVNSGVSSSATSIVIKTPDTYPRWVVSADPGIPSNTFPMQVMIAGEMVSVTAISGTSSLGGFWIQTMTCTRSINGVVKAQAADNAVTLRRVLRFGR